MKSLSLKTEMLIMVLMLPLVFFVTSGLVSNDKDLSFNYLLMCIISVIPGVLLGAGFSKYFLRRMSKIKFFPFIVWLISLVACILLSVIVTVFVQPHLSVLGRTEFMLGFFISAWSLSLNRPTDD